jgi:HEAT repeat protein
VLLKPTQLHARLSAIHYLDFTNPEQQPWIALIDELRRAADAHQPSSIRLPANTPPLVRKAIEALDSIDVEEQSRAIRALVQIDHPSAREALAGAVHHATRDVRISAALELARFKDPRAVPGLIESQRYWQLRWEFVRLISALGSAAVSGLVEALHSENDSELREYAAHALGEIKDSSAVPPLTIALQDKVTSVRDAAARALEKIKSGQ